VGHMLGCSSVKDSVGLIPEINRAAGMFAVYPYTGANPVILAAIRLS
jgi:hypothetical protein